MHQIGRLVRLLMVDCAGNLTADVGDQPAAERDVQQLMAAADGQERLALAENLINQDDFAQVTPAAVGGLLDGPADGARQLAGVKIGIDVIPAG
jgi:hypothetical protein